MTTNKYILQSNYTDGRGNFFPRNSVIELTEEQANSRLFENKLIKIEEHKQIEIEIKQSKEKEETQLETEVKTEKPKKSKKKKDK
jgi:hypothetical protein